MKKKRTHDLLNYSDLNKMAGRHGTDPQMDSPGDSSQFALEEVDIGMAFDGEEAEGDIPVMDRSHVDFDVSPPEEEEEDDDDDDDEGDEEEKDDKDEKDEKAERIVLAAER